jgi:hypothetical protein
MGAPSRCRARALAFAITLGALSVVSPGARAASDAERGPCRDAYAHVRAPIAIATEGADFAGSAAACGGQRVALDLRADATIAASAPEFYGNLRGAALLSGTFAPSDRFWIDAAADVARYDFVANASIVAKGFGAGPATLTVHGVLERSARLQVAPFVRALLPLESGWANALRVGIEPGLAALLALSPRWSLQASASYPLQTTWLGRRVTWRFTPRATLDLDVAPLRWLELLAGLEVRLVADPDGNLDALTARSAIRAHLGRGVDVHFEVAVPFAGFDRALARVALGLAVRW